ncbi:hypothetical protein M5689_005104 [Euphorbia peplus]|nr:hypothetical protein M5689_005104 [Euphorbia peplus]
MAFYSPEPHFLEACHLCRKHIGSNSDIFMYRGNTPFCSKECRQEQIEIDEYSTKKKAWKISSSSSSPSSTRSIRNSDSKEVSNETVRTGTVTVA